MEVLGAWVGALDRRVEAAIVSAAEEHKPLFDALAHNRMPRQLSLLILRVCGQPRMNYLSRVTPPRVARAGMERFDHLIVECVQARMALPVFDDARKAHHILSMPIRTGGCGLRRYSLIMHAAYLSSVACAAHLFDRDFVRAQCEPSAAVPVPAPAPVLDASGAEARARDSEPALADAALRVAERVSIVRDVNECLRVVLEQGMAGQSFPQSAAEFWREYESESKVPPHLQQTIVAFTEAERMRERETWPLSDRAAILSARQRNASLWLTVIPDQRSLQLNDYDFRAALCLRLHLFPLSRSHGQCKCREPFASARYDHFFLCAEIRKSLLFARHERVVRCVQMLAARAGVTVQLNVHDPLSGDQRQPDFQLDGLTTRIIGDVVVSHPAAPSHAERSALQALSAATRAEAQKNRKYRDRAVNGYTLSHVSLETFGGMAKGVRRIIRALATEAEENGALSFREYCAWALSALSVALQAGNGRVVDGGQRSAH
jgi:hypothetical protein